MRRRILRFLIAGLCFVLAPRSLTAAERLNVLLIMSDDLTATALSCYGNTVCQTPNIDALAKSGVRFTRAYCQATYCGPSRASMLSGYYPHATGILGYKSPRPRIGDRWTWPECFKQAKYYTARVSKIFHMGVPGDIEKGNDGADDPRSWVERFNCKGPEWKAPGRGATLEGNPDGKKPVVGGNTFVYVAADGGDDTHSDGLAAKRACELIAKHSAQAFFIALGFVRPHVPFVAPARYFEPYPADAMTLPKKLLGDWDDIPRAGINYKTSRNMQMNVDKQRQAVAAYYAAVAYMDAQVGKVLHALDDAAMRDRTIVIFTSDHGYHLGEHDFWAKVSLHEESVRVPLIIRAPGNTPAVCESFVELIDLYPTTATLCGIAVPKHVQGRDVSKLLDEPTASLRERVFSVNGKGFLLRDRDWAFVQYGEDASRGIELYDMRSDPQQFHNLAGDPESKARVEYYRQELRQRLIDVRNNDLPPK